MHVTGQGIVFRKSQGTYIIHSDGALITCSISSRLRKALVYPTSSPFSGTLRRVRSVEEIREVDPVAIGDTVRFVDAGNGTAMITEIAPRRNKLVRQSTGPRPIEQVIVANVDQIVAVIAAAQPTPKWQMLDRYLLSAEAAGVSALICLTKLDVADERETRRIADIYERIGYRVLLTSTVNGRGVEAFGAAIQDKVSVFVGMSGVGKTSLLNAVQPGLGLRVNEISRATGKGKHTTTHLEMFALDGGGSVVDTPGMKVFGLWEVDGGDVASLFAEMRPYIGHCRFRLDCTHMHEPGCAIKDAQRDGHISALRYQSYLDIARKLRPKSK